MGMFSDSDFSKATVIAGEVRRDLETINANLKRLRELGFNNARIVWNDADRSVSFAASRTHEVTI